LNVSAKTLPPKLRQSIDVDATLYTDWASLYTHVRGAVHTNNIECFWSALKRTIGGTYTHVNPRHLDRYLAEQMFRFDEQECGWSALRESDKGRGWEAADVQDADGQGVSRWV